jgi:hypothetical protein
MISFDCIQVCEGIRELLQLPAEIHSQRRAPKWAFKSPKLCLLSPPLTANFPLPSSLLSTNHPTMASPRRCMHLSFLPTCWIFFSDSVYTMHDYHSHFCSISETSLHIPEALPWVLSKESHAGNPSWSTFSHRKTLNFLCFQHRLLCWPAKLLWVSSSWQVEQPAFAVTGVNNEEDLASVLIQLGIVACGCLIVMPVRKLSFPESLCRLGSLQLIAQSIENLDRWLWEIINLWETLLTK